jgi:hypothetical protein
MVGQGGEQGEISCETDRFRFVGRGGTLANPAAMQGISPLSNTAGSVLDPIISLRRTVALPPHETAIIDLVLGVTESREAALAHLEKYQSSRMADRAFDLAWTHSQVTLRQLNVSEAEAQLYGRLAGALIYAAPPAGPTRVCCSTTVAAKAAFGVMASRAMRRSSCSASATRRRSRSSGN